VFLNLGLLRPNYSIRAARCKLGYRAPEHHYVLALGDIMLLWKPKVLINSLGVPVTKTINV